MRVTRLLTQVSRLAVCRTSFISARAANAAVERRLPAFNPLKRSLATVATTEQQRATRAKEPQQKQLKSTIYVGINCTGLTGPE
jgi:hypothetical protein